MSMGIYLHNMEIPKDRPVCIVIDVAGQARRYDLNNDKYADDKLFEAVSVPSHGRCIDADALEQDFKKLVYQDNWYYNSLHHAPTIIPAEEGE